MKLSVREIAIFGMLGGVMFASKIAMEFLPNVHLLGTLIIAYTLVYREKALYPIYTFVLLQGIFAGFAAWWVPYLYVWAVLWAGAMALPQNLPPKIRAFVYMLLCGAHGLLYGTLYAPAQAILFGLSFRGMVAWVLAGLPFDVVHGVSNFCCGALILPLVSALRLAEKSISHSG